MDVGIRIFYTFLEKLDVRGGGIVREIGETEQIVDCACFMGQHKERIFAYIGKCHKWMLEIFYTFFGEIRCAVMELFERSMKLKKLLIAFHGITQGTRLCIYWRMSNG